MNQRAVGYILIASLTLAAMGRIAVNDFSGWDDPDNFTNNPRLNPPSMANALEYWTTPQAGLYVPVTWMVWTTLAAIAKGIATAKDLPAWPFHVASLLVHIGAALLVYEIFLRLLPDRAQFPATLGALLFALHPIQVETVAWASGLKDQLCALFALLAIWQYILAARASSRARLHYSIALFAAILSMLSKPTGIVIFAMCAVIDVLLLGRPIKRAVIAALPFALLAMPVLVVARIVQETGEQFAPPLWQRPMVAGDALAFYLRKLAIPWPLGLDYGRTPRSAIDSGAIYLWWILPALIGVILVVTRARWLGVAMLLLICGLAPTLGLTPFQFQFNSTVSDHYLYLAMFGPALAVAWINQKSHAPIIIGITGALLLVFAVLSFMHAGYWKNSQTLFAHALDVNPRSAMAHNNVGTALAARGELQAAAAHFEAALQSVPIDPTAHRNLARVRAELGDVDSAIFHLDQSLRLKEAALGHAARDPSNAPLLAFDHNLLGRMMLSRGRRDQAIAHLARAVELEPHSAKYAGDLAAAR
jgi:tetratricopeptide (TPR) repeat protein